MLGKKPEYPETITLERSKISILGDSPSEVQPFSHSCPIIKHVERSQIPQPIYQLTTDWVQQNRRIIQLGLA